MIATSLFFESLGLNAGPKPLTLDIIRTEHAAIERAIDAIHTLIAPSNEGRIDFEAVRVLVEYLARFPQQHHHPREEDHLFDRVILRSSDAVEVLLELRMEHSVEVDRIATLRLALDAWEQGRAFTAAGFIMQLTRYEDFARRHMRIEEEVLLPMALTALRAEDWREIDAAMSLTAPLDPVVHSKEARQIVAEAAPIVSALSAASAPRTEVLSA